MPERGWHSGQKRRTNLPTHDVLQQYSSTAADALAQTELLCRTLGFPFFNDSPSFRGASNPSPGGSFHAPRSPSRSSAPVLSPVRQRAAVWDGRGATARPREAKRRSGVAGVFWVFITKIFPKIEITTTSQAYYILRSNKNNHDTDLVVALDAQGLYEGRRQLQQSCRELVRRDRSRSHKVLPAVEVGVRPKI